MNYLEEYMISLGFEANMPELAKLSGAVSQFQGIVGRAASSIGSIFTGVMSDSDKVVADRKKKLTEDEKTQLAAVENIAKRAKETVGTMKEMATEILKWQAEIVAMFVAIGTATLGIADKVVMADQSYRLFAQRMFMTADAGKALKRTLDILGEPLEVVQWDPFLNRLAGVMAGDTTKMQGEVPDFRQQMDRLQEIRGEFKRLQNVGEEFMDVMVVGLARAFGPGLDKVMAQLSGWIDWIVQNLPAIQQEWQRFIIPILNDTWDVMTDVVDVFKLFGNVVANTIGLLSGDESITGTTTSFAQMAKAVDHVVHFLATFVHWVTEAEMVVLHLVNAIALLAHGDFGAARAELGKGVASLGAGAAGILGVTVGGAGGGLTGAVAGGAIGSMFGPVGTVLGAGFGATFGVGVGAVAGGAAGAYAGSENPYYTPREYSGIPGGSGGESGAGGTPIAPADALKEAQRVGAMIGLDPKLLFEQWAHETDGFKKVAAINNMGGIRYPGSKEYRQFSSLDDYGNFYANLMQSKRYTSQGVLGAQTPEQMAGALKRGSYFEDNYENYVGGMKARAPLYEQTRAAQGGAPPITIGKIEVNVAQTGATGEEIQKHVEAGAKKVIKDHVDNVTRNDIFQLGQN